MFTRLSNIVRGFFGLFVSDLEKKNPEALLELEKENLRKQIANYNQGLAAHAGLCEKLIGQTKRLEKECEELRAKTTANLRANNQALAGQIAMRYQSSKRELEENRLQLADAEKTYNELVRAREVSINEAKKKIEDLSRGLKEVQIVKATADLNEMAAGLVTQLGSGGDTLNRLSEIVEEQRTSAAGRARVARDSMNVSTIEAMQSEQSALEEMALADFAAAEGLDLPGAPAKSTAENPRKTMGAEEASQ